MELLLPAGNFENLKIAIENGADAVYLGYKRFNARAKANNFDFKELKKAIEYCHKNGVKTYITLNTLIKNREIKDFLKTIDEVYLAGADAIILQEISFAKIIKQNYPDMEIHSSTQARLQNLENLEYIDRVILPRELKEEEIEEIQNNLEKNKKNIELELFVQGAMCFCISGLCLMSSFIGQRSGNRGICAQPCRKKYNDDYLMSMKDLSLIKKVKDIEKLNITSIKIEGRLRSKNYVKNVTQLYRKSLDGKEITNKDLEKVKIIFTRELTEGYYSDKKNRISKQNINFKDIEHEIYNYKNTKKPIQIKKRISKNINLNFENKKPSEKGFYVKVYNLKGIREALDFKKVKVIFYSIDKENIHQAIDLVHDAGKQLYAVLPSIVTDKEVEEYIEKINEINPDGVLVNSFAFKDKFENIIYEYGMNSFNDQDLEFYKKSIISPELSFKDLKEFKNKDFLTLVHGNVIVMTTRNPLPQKLKYDEKFTFPTIKAGEYTKVINSKQIAILDKILELKKEGIEQYYFDIHQNIRKWLDIYSRILDGDKLNCKKIGKGFTLGHFYKNVWFIKKQPKIIKIPKYLNIWFNLP